MGETGDDLDPVAVGNWFVQRRDKVVKLAIGLVIFFLSARLTGRSEKAVKFREQETKWLNLLCVLMLALVLVAGYMKFASAGASAKEPTEKVEATAWLISQSE